MDPSLLALRFKELLKRDLGDNYDKAVELNRLEADPYVCHTHDFIDANMTMAEAFEEVFGRKPDVDSNEDCALWGQAWNMWIKETMTIMTTYHLSTRSDAVQSVLCLLSMDVRGPLVHLGVADSVSWSPEWSGGSRESGSVWDLVTGRQLSTPARSPFGSAEFGMPLTVDLFDDRLVALYRTWSGKNQPLKLVVNRNTAHKYGLMPDRSHNLTREQVMVLFVTDNYRPTGRFNEVRHLLSAAEYERIVQDLVADGYLKANRSISTKGHNVVAEYNRISDIPEDFALAVSGMR